MDIERTTTHETTICDTHIPTSTHISVSIAESARDITVYGSDAEVFRPERWTEATEERWKEMERLSMVFSNGRRLCVGHHLAKIEMRKVIASLVMSFKVNVHAAVPWATRSVAVTR